MDTSPKNFEAKDNEVTIVFVFLILMIGIGHMFLIRCTPSPAPTPPPQICYTAEICDWQDFQAEVKRRNLPFPELWTQISIQESGWNYQSSVASTGNNVMGFICIPSKTCYNGHIQFDAKINCIDYLEWWIRKNPPRPHESDTGYIKRRGYNPDSSYCKTVKSIKL